MASVLVQIDGVFWDDAEKKGTKGTMYGQLFRPDLSVGGGPMPPQGPVDPGYGVPGPPPGIWPSPGHPAHPIAPGGPPPHPAHPIVLPPPTVWPPKPGDAHPEHPIVIPPPVDEKPPDIPPGTLIEWKAVWTPDRGWMVIGFPNVPHPSPSK